jgi:hypothetical protein
MHPQAESRTGQESMGIRMEPDWARRSTFVTQEAISMDPPGCE